MNVKAFLALNYVLKNKKPPPHIMKGITEYINYWNVLLEGKSE